MNKANIRKYIRKIKKNYSEEDLLKKSSSVIYALEHNKQFVQANIILAYWSLPDEIYTHELVKSLANTSRTILLPCISGDNLILREFTNENNLSTETNYHISEPIGQPFTQLDAIDLVLVPGMAFDKNGGRLGRGKGYYDKLLTQLPTAYKLGLAFDFQLIENIPLDKHDILMDNIIASE